jgi:hypothetical protein
MLVTKFLKTLPKSFTTLFTMAVELPKIARRKDLGEAKAKNKYI